MSEEQRPEKTYLIFRVGEEPWLIHSVQRQTDVVTGELPVSKEQRPEKTYLLDRFI